MNAGALHGLLVIDKPSGITSRDAVNQIQRILPRRTRVGHAGTLDPLATGVLVVCIGAATRLTEYVQQMDKEYSTDIVLGATSTTDDADGDITELPGAKEPARSAIEEGLHHFIGNIAQIPPAHSAIKVKGKRAYELARKGADVQLSARPVHVYDIEIIQYDYPILSLRIRCGKGTFIRSIARDLGEKLGSGGYVKTLRRSRIGTFRAEQAAALDDISTSLEKYLQPIETAVAELLRIDVTAAQENRLRQGQKVFLDRPMNVAEGKDVAVFSGGRLSAIGRMDASGRILAPQKVLISEPRTK